MQYGTINDITNLKFYTDNGHEIPMQKQYSLTWHFKAGKLASQYMQDDLYGYFIGDIDLSRTGDIRILEKTIVAGILKEGNIQVRFSTEYGTDKNGMRIFKYTREVLPYEYYQYMRTILLDSDNKVTLSINVNGISYTAEYGFYDIFTMTAESYSYEDYYNINTIYTGNNIADDYEYYQVIQVAHLDFVTYGDEGKPYIQELFEQAVPNIGIYFPFVVYEGSYHQEMISEGFIAADTLMVLEENYDILGNPEYHRPYINADSEYYIAFKPTDNSGELKMVKKDLEYELEYTDEISFDLAYYEEEHEDLADPLYFTIAFQTDTEGSYQNYLGMYMKSKNDPDLEFYMGIISVKTMVEGEDERFRTLLTNFGVPDPVYYSNIFAEQDYDEQGKDYELINRKSKQMMLTYDQMFSYVGTYKALMNAIKFLGYYDIIFKEWYTLRTSNDTNVDVAVQVFDTSNGTYLKQKLADYGISVEDFANYNKINKLSMIYHINEESGNIEETKTQLVKYNASTGRIEYDPSVGDVTFTTPTGVPLTKPVSIYRNDEILTKLFAVKQWLERHIIGVGAYIADITGEGLYFGWQKTQGYQTQHHLTDFSQCHYYTPRVKVGKPFKNSSTDIICSLTELSGSVTIDDYSDYTFDDFIRYEHAIDMETTDGVTCDVSALVISNTIETPVFGDEIEYDLVLKTGTGTLHEWTDDSSSEIFFDGGEIKILYEKDYCASVNNGMLPYITLENANIHNVYGSWDSNIEWMVREVIDSETGNTVYKLKNYKSALEDSYAVYDNAYFILEKDPDINDAYLKYTEDTKWGMPMFMIHGFRFMNADISADQLHNFDIASGHYIIEVLKGDMLFKKSKNCGVKVLFSNDFLANDKVGSGIYDKEQRVELEYTYQSDRVPFVVFDEKQIISETQKSFDFSSTVNPIIKRNNTSVFAQYTDMANNILKRNGKSAEKSVAYQELMAFMNSSVTEDTSMHQSLVKEQMEKQMLYDTYTSICKDNYICHKDTSVNVTRIGQYDIIAKAYDRYNNTFVSKYPKQVTVSTKPIYIDAFTYNAASGNDANFYRYNMAGEKMSNGDIKKIADKCNTRPMFPMNYKINSFDYDANKYTVQFENMSYSIDTPYNNDYMIFENCTERCEHAHGGYGTGLNSLVLWMLDENHNKAHLYGKYTKTVNVVIYDKLLMDDISVFSGTILNSSLVNPKKDIDINSNSYLDIRFTGNTTVQEVSAMINNKNNITYVINTTGYGISNFALTTDYDNNMTYMVDKYADHTEPLFNVEDVVKIRYDRNYNIPDKEGTSHKYNTISETAYRITKIYVHTDNARIDMSRIDFEKFDKTKIKKYEYVINGRLNETLMVDSTITTSIMYANQYPVHYVTNVIGDGVEFNKNIGYDDYHVLYDQFVFDSKHMSLYNYIDDTYSCRIMDYDMKNLTTIWNSSMIGRQTYNDIDMYYYHNFPVTVSKGKLIIMTHNDKDNILEPGYHVEWADKAILLDKVKNRLAYSASKRKETLYRSVNEFVSINPEILGAHDMTLTCIDKFGNKVVNEGGGKYFVKA